jgi:4-hydroxy-3-methylbut-2-enyl diphosphate reductase
MRLLQLSAHGCGMGQLLAAGSFSDPDRGPIECAAAPLLAAALEERSEKAGTGPRFRAGVSDFARRHAPSPPNGVMFAVSYLDRDGAAGGFAVAAHQDDEAGKAVASAAAREWMGVARSRRLVLDDGAPLCWGGQRALRLMGRSAADPAAAYVLGRPVADPESLYRLQSTGALFNADAGTVPDGAHVVIPAHGATPAQRSEAAARGLRVTDGTCPLVAAAQADAAAYADRGDLVVVIGRAGNAAVPSLTAQAHGAVAVAQTPDAVPLLQWADGDRVSFVIDPGMPAMDALPVLAALRARFPRVRGHHLDVMCAHSTDRLHAVSSIAAESDLLLIIAGNGDDAGTRHMARIADRAGTRHQVIRRLADVSPRLLREATALGLATALSAPAGLADQLLTALAGLGPLSVRRRNVHTRREPLSPCNSGEGTHRHAAQRALLA